MRTSNIDFCDVTKRKISTNSDPGADCLHIYKMARKSLNENKSTSNIDVEKFFNSCKDSRNANVYYSNCLSLIECVNDELKNKVVSVFSKDIVPYIRDLNSLKESVNISNIDDNSKSIILNSIKENKICDRILSNDKMIKKRFNLENFIDECRYLPLENIVFECCFLLDTYDNIPSYGKMNIALEQLSYYLQKQNLDYDKARFVELVTEYFLYRNTNLKSSTKNRYKNVLRENIMISDSDLENVKYFVESDYVDYYDIRKTICDFNNSECKDIGSLKAEIQDIFEKSPHSVIDHFSYILETIRHLLMIGTYNFDNVQDIVRYVPTRSIEKNLNVKYMHKLNDIYNMEIEILEKQMHIITGDKYKELQNYYNCISDCITKINDYFYKSSDYECRNTDDRLKAMINKSAPVSSLQEFKIFKFDNLIKATLKIDKFLRIKSKNIVSKIKNKSNSIFKIKKDYFKESLEANDILKLGIVTEDNSIDICIAIYEVKDDEIGNVNSLMEALCVDIRNNILYENKDMDVYYTNIGNIFELHLENNVYLNLTEDEEDIKNNAISERDSFYMDKLLSMSESLEKLSNIDIDNIIPSCNKLIESTQNADYLKTIIEALSYTNIISRKDIINLKESYSDIYPDNYRDNTILNCAVEECLNNKENEIPFEVQVEALQLVDELLKEDASSIEGKLNSLKLSMMGLKKKAKDLSSKEKEMSRTLDATVNMLYRSVKQALVSDRREAIIKGSVIPSFSKLIKIGIALAGVGLITQSIVIPAIAIIAGLAMSKNLTRKERSLMLDEIDIELKVVEKEIQMAENSNNMKKYRKLITFQKKLERERARIRYGLKAGRDLPDTSTND